MISFPHYSEKNHNVSVGTYSNSDSDSGDPDGIFLFPVVCHFSVIFPQDPSCDISESMPLIETLILFYFILKLKDHHPLTTIIIVIIITK